jgi:hypothetical protein
MGPKLSVSVQNSVTKETNTTLVSYVQNIQRNVQTTIKAGNYIYLVLGATGSCKSIEVNSRVDVDTALYFELTADQCTDLKSKVAQASKTALDSLVENEDNILSGLGPKLGVTVQNIKSEIDNYFSSSNVQGIDVNTNTRVFVGNNVEVTLNGKTDGPCKIDAITNVVTEVQDKIAASLQGLVDSDAMQAIISDAKSVISNTTSSLLVPLVIAGGALVGLIVLVKLAKKKKKKGPARTSSQTDKSPRLRKQRRQY